MYSGEKGSVLQKQYIRAMCTIRHKYTHQIADSVMRTNIVIEDELMENVLHITGIKTKREAVQQGLELLLLLSKQARIKEFRGKLKWEGDLNEMRNW